MLKARQLGMTTYIAARFFIQTITQPGTTAVQVAHNQESAEEIFKIVHRFWENLPEGMRQGALVTSRSNVRQIVFPRLDSEYRVATAADANAGRGMTIHNLALFGGRPLAPRRNGNAGIAARGGAGEGRDRAGIHAQRGGRSVLRGMATRRRNRIHAALLSLVV